VAGLVVFVGGAVFESETVEVVGGVCRLRRRGVEGNW